MSDVKPNVIPPEPSANDSRTPEDVAQPQHPEEILADRLEEQASEVTSQLWDLLPEAPVALPEPVSEAAAEAVAPDTAAEEPVERLPQEPAGASAGADSQAAAAPSTPAVAPNVARQTKRLLAPGGEIESSGDDRLMSALAWLTMVILQLPIVSVIQLLSPTTKDRPFQRHHAVTSLLFYAAAVVYEIVAGIVYTILGAITLGCGYACLWVIFFLPHALSLYYALQAYNGKTVELPILSNFGRQQTWL